MPLIYALSWGVLPLVAGLFALFTAMPRGPPSGGDVTGMPWWAPPGGITGAVAVFVGLLLIQELGGAKIAYLS